MEVRLKMAICKYDNDTKFMNIHDALMGQINA